MNNHPEQGEDEIFLGNIKTGRESIVKWTSARFGLVAYKSDGEVDTGARPAFVRVSDVEQVIAKLRADDRPWAKLAVASLEEMLLKRTLHVGDLAIHT